MCSLVSTLRRGRATKLNFQCCFITPTSSNCSVCLCCQHKAAAVSFRKRGPGLFSFSLLCFHISKTQPDVECVRDKVGGWTEANWHAMLEGSAQFRTKKGGGTNSFSHRAESLCPHLTSSECWSQLLGFSLRRVRLQMIGRTPYQRSP